MGGICNSRLFFFSIFLAPLAKGSGVTETKSQPRSFRLTRKRDTSSEPGIGYLSERRANTLSRFTLPEAPVRDPSAGCKRAGGAIEKACAGRCVEKDPRERGGEAGGKMVKEDPRTVSTLYVHKYRIDGRTGRGESFRLDI